MSVQSQLVVTLEEIGQMMELLGEDSYRVSAHARAARVIGDLTDDIEELAKDRAKVLAIEGIGPKLADKIIEFCETGRIPEHAELLARVPAGLLPLLSVSGLGPKTLRMLWQQGGVTDRASLEAIIASGAILTLPRMGAKSVEKIKQSLAFAAAGGQQRLSIGLVLPVAEAWVSAIEKVPGVKSVAFAGSLRRGKDSIGDIDILATSAEPELLADAFCAMPGVTNVLAKGATKCSVRIAVPGMIGRWKSKDEAEPPEAGFQIDLRVIPKESWGAALLYFTGSKEHNVALRERALSRGMTLNEYGLYKLDAKSTVAKAKERDHEKGELVASRTEADVYRVLELPFIPPEIRENHGELVLKETPRLVEVADVQAELHAHTTASDGRLSIRELAERAKGLGFHTIAVTDHSKSSYGVANGLSPERLREHIKGVRRVNEEIEGITVLAGSEVDILADGSLDYSDELLAELDVVVASPHVSLAQDSETATARLLRAIRHPLVHIIGHPTGRLINRRRGLEPDIRELAAAAKEHDVALEINTHWMRLDLRDLHVRVAMDAGCVVVINNDVHESGDFEHLRLGVLTARRGGVTPERCVNTWTAKKLHGWLKAKR